MPESEIQSLLRRIAEADRAAPRSEKATPYQCEWCQAFFHTDMELQRHFLRTEHDMRRN